MKHTLGNPDDKPVKAEKGDRLEGQLSFKSRFVLVFGEVNVNRSPFGGRHEAR
jgi:hypothetical protein